jgi:DNA-binding XRE family transcriptional regulator
MKLAHRRRELGLTQTDLAKRVGVTPNAICMYETGKRNPSLKVMLAITSVLNATVEDLFGDGDEEVVL